MTSVLLIYPYFLPAGDRSVFRFPPLGIGYVAASLRHAGHDVRILDCTFLSRESAMERALSCKVDVVGIYCMVTMREDCLAFASALRAKCRLLVAGGPLPTCDPALFLPHFDVVVLGEGEQTMVDLIETLADKTGLSAVRGIAYTDKKTNRVVCTEPRTPAGDLDQIPFPARDLLPNSEYIRHGKKKNGFSVTTVMSTRGCPHKCEFCSNVVFGGSYRERSVENVVDEIESALDIGYDRISFSDDVFTMNKSRVLAICGEIRRRNLSFGWECLGRADAVDYETAAAMKQAGCTRIYFGIESGSDRMLSLMNKNLTVARARSAVLAAHAAGLEVGAFFILFYPGDTTASTLETLRFALSLPLDYLGLTPPYPLPGTALYKRVSDRINREWRPGENMFMGHTLVFKGNFSALKIWFGIIAGRVRFEMKRRLGFLAPVVLPVFSYCTDGILRLIR
jgi:anaerobic magnesium-protoporphyrin IX monomethyl ester cyclase